jgi:response regulator RpfG family c-di-GMP phosphodiesterase
MPAHILVVDDEPGIREMLTTWLDSAGFESSSAADAVEALAVIERRPADVALLDLALPGKDGVWLARQLRAAQRDTALIMVTGLQRFDAAVEGMRLGVMDYLLKPFSRRQLLESVSRAVEWRESTLRQRAELDALRREIKSNSQALAEAFQELKSASAGALESLVVTLDTRNPDASAHAKRVAEMAVKLGQALGVSGQALVDVEHGALLHDIGKVAMPDALIHKPGPLTEEEITIIRTHAQIGHDIIAVVPSLREAARIVLYSHEAWDGTGYPFGLSGDEIPIGSRITAVVDTFDALTWGRVYRDAVSYARAAAELVRCSGSQFDPDVVHAWLRLVDTYPRAVAV